MNRLTVSVVICVYSEERWHDLGEAIRSLNNQTVAAGEIVVVVDHNPTLYERVQACFGAQIKSCENTQTPGLSGGRNSGVARASGDVIAFLDDDAIASPDWIERLVDRFQDHNVLGVGGAIEPDWKVEHPNVFPQEFYWVFGCTYLGMPIDPTPVRNVIGCNMAFRREVFQTVGGFRTEIGRVGKNPVGCEETEFCIRVNQIHPDHLIIYDPAIRVRHRVPENRTSVSYFRSRCFAEGKSKAVVSRLVGSRDGLSSERTHALRVLPRGVARGIADTLIRGDSSGIIRSSLIVIGLAVTVSGYCIGLLNRNLSVSPGQSGPLEHHGAVAISESGSD